MGFGDELLRRRMELKLTQFHLAQKIGISKSMVQNYEKQKGRAKRMVFETAVKISRVMGWELPEMSKWIEKEHAVVDENQEKMNV